MCQKQAVYLIGINLCKLAQLLLKGQGVYKGNLKINMETSTHQYNLNFKKEKSEWNKSQNSQSS